MTIVYDVRLKCTHTDGSWHYYRTTQTTLDATINCPQHSEDGCTDTDFVIEDSYDNGE